MKEVVVRLLVDDNGYITIIQYENGVPNYTWEGKRWDIPHDFAFILESDKDESSDEII